MEHPEGPNPEQHQKKPYIPEKYVWKRSYTLVLLANVFYILFFYLLMKIFI